MGSKRKKPAGEYSEMKSFKKILNGGLKEKTINLNNLAS